MKKLYALMLALILMGPLAIVHARDGADDTQFDDNKERSGWFKMSDDKRDAMKERNELMRQKMEDHREEWKEKREDFRREHAYIFIDRIKAHFEWAIKWSQNIHDRMLAYVEKIEDRTDDTLTEARAHLEDAQTHIDEATDALEDIVIPDKDDDATDEENKAKVEAVRALFAEVKEHLKEARESLRLAMQEIKEQWSNDRDGKKTEDSE